MFTGIVEELGTVESIEDQGDALRLTIRAAVVLEDAGLGDSIAVNGCCLTVAGRTGETWTADVMQETLDKTGLGSVAPGDRVNLERAVTVDKRPAGTDATDGADDGQGDGQGSLARYLVDKGSITVDGVSLTVVSTSPTGFTVSLIPETLARTTLGTRQPGDPVNLEVDILAKHVEKLLAGGLANRLPAPAAGADPQKENSLE